MTYSAPSHTAYQRRRSISVAVLALVTVALLAAAANTLGLGGSPEAGTPGASTIDPSTTTIRDVATTTRASHGAPGNPGGTGEEGQGSQGVTVFDSKAPSVANLDPDLRAALKRAALDARDDGIVFDVNSGWRSAAYQRTLLDDAIERYGSEAEARKWVATPETSEHVSGDAVDLGPSKAAKWLGKHGAGYGLCQIYRNEPWHFELRPDAVNAGCPAMYANPTQDPRMRQ
jgi:hypothetical protein